MTRVRSSLQRCLLLLVVAAVSLMSLVVHGQAARRIAGFGSSVAFGTGDESGMEGYTGLLRTMLAPRGWEVLNQSRGGDTTKLLATRWAPENTADSRTRYLLPVKPGYVIIGLSLANEGIFEAATKDDKDAVYQQYADGIRGLVARARRDKIVPVVTLCYPRAVYTSVEYDYIKRMNILENSWDVPSVNFLGAVDDGNGRWARGFMFNDKHPNTSGHHELALTFVPTLFDALEKGKPVPTVAAAGHGFARISGGAAPLTFTPESTIHSFAVSFSVRAQGNGAVAAVSGSTLAAKIEQKRSGGAEFEEATLTAEREFASAIGPQNGKWTYSNGTSSVASGVTSDDAWHHVVLSHYAGRGETLFFVDGQLAGRVNERLEPNRFVVGGPGSAAGQAPRQADYKDLFIFRSALNADEVAVLRQGKVLQSSLEIYSPLADAQFVAGSGAENRAQSLAALKVGTGRIAHMDETVVARR